MKQDYTWREASLADWDFLVATYDDIADPAIGQFPFNQALKPQFEAKKMPLDIANYPYRLRYYYVLEKPGEGRPLGVLVNSLNPEEGTEEFGIAIPKANQRKGIGLSVLKDFLGWRIPRTSGIHCLVAKANAVSLKVFTRLGGRISGEKIFSAGGRSIPVAIFDFK